MEEECEDLDLRAAGTIELCPDEMLCNVMSEKTSSSLWAKLESLYKSRNLSNRLPQATIRVAYGRRCTSIHDHLCVFKKLVSDLLCQ